MAVKDFDYFEDHKPFMDESLDDPIANSLFFLRGGRWRDMRATLSPAFTGSKMRQMFELVLDCSADMSAFLKQKALKGDAINVEVKELYSKHTTDIIASTAFGIKTNSLENEKNDFYKNSKILINFGNFKSILRFLILRTIPAVGRYFNMQFVDSEVGAFFKSIILDTMDVRSKQNIFRPDMINLLMQIKKGNYQQITDEAEEKHTDGFATVEESQIGKNKIKREWSDNEIVAQCFLFFLAGFDTTSSFLSFASYELAINNDIQDKLYAEIFETNSQLSGKSLSYDVLQKMKYMDMFVSEVLRHWPPAALTDRMCVKDYSYDDGELKFTVKKGDAIWIPIYPIHHDPHYFPDPDKFDPERFNDNNKNNIISGTYNPFGVGPRNCIGKYIIT